MFKNCVREKCLPLRTTSQMELITFCTQWMCWTSEILSSYRSLMMENCCYTHWLFLCDIVRTSNNRIRIESEREMLCGYAVCNVVAKAQHPLSVYLSIYRYINTIFIHHKMFHCTAYSNTEIQTHSQYIYWVKQYTFSAPEQYPNEFKERKKNNNRLLCFSGCGLYNQIFAI